MRRQSIGVCESAQSCARSVTNFHSKKETRLVDHEFVHGWTMFWDGQRGIRIVCGVVVAKLLLREPCMAAACLSLRES